MQHWFDDDIAVLLGLGESIVLNHIAYWIRKNRDNGINFKNGRYWTYNTFVAFQRQFPFWCERTIRTILHHLEKEGYLMTGCFNEDGRDRTTWYALTEKGEKLFPDSMWQDFPNASGKNCRSNRQNLPNASGKNCKPTNNTKKDITEKNKKSARAKLAPPFDDPPKELIDAWEGFIEMRKAKRNTPTEKAVKLIANKLEKLAPGNDLMKADILNQSTERGWQGVFPLKADYQRTQPKTYGAQQSAAEMYEEVKALMENGGGIL